MLSMLLTAVLSTVVTGHSDSLSYEQAYQIAQTNGKPLMVVVSSDACPACVTLKSNTIESMQNSGELAGVSVAVVNKDADPQLASRLMRGKMIPQIIVFSQSEQGWKRLQLTGYQEKSGVRSLIRQAVQNQRIGS